MAQRDHGDGYSRLVGLLKIVLPLAALGILSTLFLFSRQIDPSQAIPYAEVDVEDRAREPRLSAPEYAGMTEDGSEVSVRAAVATPDAADPGLVRTERVEAIIRTATGEETRIAAGKGEIDSAGGQLRVSDGVSISTAPGYSVTTAALQAALGRTDIRAGSAVLAEGPLGRIDAGGMTISTRPERADSHVLVFNTGVRLVYRPQPKGSQP